MAVPVLSIPPQKLLQLGLKTSGSLHYQQSPTDLINATLSLGEGMLNDTGALVIQTGKFTGRSPKDRYIVKDLISQDMVDWNQVNQPFSQESFDLVFQKITDYLNVQPQLWVRDAFACADSNYRLNLRIVSEKPWVDLFAYNMFLRPSDEELESFVPGWHIFSAPGLLLPVTACGIRQENAVVISFKHKMILIAGTAYTGEMKKAVFSVLNFLLPTQHSVLSMHCAANMGRKGDTALFFGLSGTGKTTLSTSNERRLIGDDEHGWSKNGVFNIEGGCYAKCAGLDEEKEPAIFHAIKTGALVENTVMTEGTKRINFSDTSTTENTRVSYPLHFISGSVQPSTGSSPNHIFFLTCDAYGVLPPVSKLSYEQAMYHFLSGYTAKVAGTEIGVSKPRAIFSACFGAPFLPLHPSVYTGMLGEKLRAHHASVWLINTGWIGGSFGKGKRIPLPYTRAIIQAALRGELDDVAYRTEKYFGLAIPQQCPGLPNHILNPAESWYEPGAYSRCAEHLVELFVSNFEQYRNKVDEQISKGGPNQ